MRRKIRCFVYGKRSDVQRQQQDVNSRRTAEESRTRIKTSACALPQAQVLNKYSPKIRYAIVLCKLDSLI